MKLKHSVDIAIAFNLVVRDNQGRPTSAWIMPVTYFWFWLPAWLCRPRRPACRASARLIRRQRQNRARVWLTFRVAEAWLAWLICRLTMVEVALLLLLPAQTRRGATFSR